MNITKKAPGIDMSVVRKGLEVYYLPTGKSDGLSGYTLAVTDRAVTLKGIVGSKEETRQITADQLATNDYQALRWSDKMQNIYSEDVTAWTVEDAVDIIDPDVCRPSYFIVFKKAGATSSYFNGIILSVRENDMTVITIQSGRAVNMAISVADALTPGFIAEVSPSLTGGGGENYGTVTLL